MSLGKKFRSLTAADLGIDKCEACGHKTHGDAMCVARFAGRNEVVSDDPVTCKCFGDVWWRNLHFPTEAEAEAVAEVLHSRGMRLYPFEAGKYFQQCITTDGEKIADFIVTIHGKMSDGEKPLDAIKEAFWFGDANASHLAGES